MSYNGQESGSLETSSALADKKSPMKDVFILDLFAQGPLHQESVVSDDCDGVLA